MAGTAEGKKTWITHQLQVNLKLTLESRQMQKQSGPTRPAWRRGPCSAVAGGLAPLASALQVLGAPQQGLGQSTWPLAWSPSVSPGLPHTFLSIRQRTREACKLQLAVQGRHWGPIPLPQPFRPLGHQIDLRLNFQNG